MTISGWEIPAGVNPASPWPYPEAPARVAGAGDWRLLMTLGGSTVMWPVGEPLPRDLGAIEFHRCTRERARDFLVLFCSRGCRSDDRFIHQDGETYLFNWVSGTLAQFAIASQIADLAAQGYVRQAVDLGTQFEQEIRRKLA